MNCEEFRDKLTDPTALAAVEIDHEAMLHVAACENCRARLGYEKQLMTGFAQIGNRQPPVALADRIIGIPAAERAKSGSSTPWRLLWKRYWFQTSLATGLAVLFLAVSLTFLAPAPTPAPLARQTSPTLAAAPTESLESPAARPPLAGQLDGVAPEGQSALAGGDLAAADTAPADGIAPALAPMETAGILKDDGGRDEEPKTFEMAKAEGRAKDNLPSTADVITPRPLAVELPRSAPIPAAPAPAHPPAALGEVARDSAQVLAAPTAPKADQDGAFEREVSPSQEEAALPMVRGQPLDEETDSFAQPPLQLSRVSPSAKEARARIAPIKAKTVDPFEAKVHSGPSAERGEILLMKGAGEGASRHGESLDDEAAPITVAKAMPYAPPPPPARPSASMAVKKVESSRGADLAPRDARHDEMERILSEHSAEIREGPLDINQWVISGWISVKERIFLAPQPRFRWMAVRRGQRWEAVLQKSSSR